MSFYALCSKCQNSTFEVLVDVERENYFFECTNPKCRWTTVYHGGKFILEQPLYSKKRMKPEKHGQ